MTAKSKVLLEEAGKWVPTQSSDKIEEHLESVRTECLKAES